MVSPFHPSGSHYRQHDLTHASAKLVITPRMGPPEPDRLIYKVSLDELTELASSTGLRLLRVVESSDHLGRDSVEWVTVAWCERSGT